MALLCMLVGGLFYAYIVGNVTSLIQEQDPFKKHVEDQVKVKNKSAHRCPIPTSDNPRPYPPKS